MGEKYWTNGEEEDIKYVELYEVVREDGRDIYVPARMWRLMDKIINESRVDYTVDAFCDKQVFRIGAPHDDVFTRVKELYDTVKKFEEYVEKNIEKMYREKSGSITVDEKKFEYWIEEWNYEAIEYECPECCKGLDGDKLEECLEEKFFDVLDEILAKEKWDGYVHIPPEKMGALYDEPLGIVVWYRVS